MTSAVGTSVEKYTIKFPVLFLTNFQKKVPIYDEDKKVVGYVERFYHKLKHKILSYYFFMDKLYINVQALDKELNKIMDLVLDNTTDVKENNRWNLTIYDDKEEHKYVFRDKSQRIDPNRYFEYENKKTPIKIVNDSAAVQPYFYGRYNHLLAKCIHDGFSRYVEIEVYEPDYISVYEVATVWFLLGSCLRA
ncbi:hypothetical protein CLPU_8c00230 [Gottschalkia purinilytica]|uniref:Tubby C-terminal domain-containing protein n=1 Tax=Gottschalkia purinilytica TaxID=1503 RepID=A0A0L0W9M8_GOTPU|nr:hypothetical protein [Gottschalkia purinilytica]KNF08258.1 hypothetical protein CLPU_8c00230 [Gottschalkia purinilytica]